MDKQNEESISGSFKKIEIPQQPTATRLPKKSAVSPRLKVFFSIFGVVLAVVLISIVIIAVSLQGVIRHGTATKASAQVLVDALKNQDLELSKKQIPVVREDIIKTQKSLSGLVWLRLVPFLGGYYTDAQHGLSAGLYGMEALEITIATLEPYADLLGLKGKSNFVAGSADDRIQTAVKTLDKVTPKLADIGGKIELLKKEIDAIDPNRYPKQVGKYVIREKLINGKALLEETVGLFINARPFLESLPQLLGEPKPKRYFIIFQNDKELRPTGGFITAFAIFRMESGKPIVERSEDIYVLDEEHGKHPPAPEEIRTYHKGVYYFNLRDSNLSPDFAKSVAQFKELYKGDFDFDGVIAVDTQVLVEALKILGSFTIAGREFSAEIDDRCDCPKVVYELEDYATRPVAYVRSARKDILGELLLQIMKKALGVSPSQYWGRLFQMGIQQINEKHILANIIDEKAQKGVELLNMGGRIANGAPILGYTDSAGWDYLHINDTNFAGAKSNLFVQHAINVEYDVGANGNIVKTLTIDYKNPAEASDCNLESGGLCLNGLLRNWVRIYVPKGSKLLENKGSQSPNDGKAIDMLVKEDLGKTVFEGFLTVRPLGSAQLTVKYELPIKASKDYTGLIQKQPGTAGHEFTILVKGKQKDQFRLTTDRIVQLSL